MAARRAAAVLALALAARAKEFDMGGQCAAVFKEQKWIAEDADGVRSHQWDYKIIVSPWTVFGKARAPPPPPPAPPRTVARRAARCAHRR